MKIKKLLVLAGTAVMLMACGGNNSKTPATSSEPVVSSENPSSEAVTPSSSTPVSTPASSSQAASSSTPASSSAAPSSSAVTTSSSTQQADRYELSFRNTVATCNKTTLGDKVKAYINDETFDGFCTSVVLDGSGEVESIDDSKLGTFRILKIGASKTGGDLSFTFASTIKSVILDVENYNKNFNNNGTEGSSQDTAVKLYVNNENTVIDLAATAGNPTKKTQEVTINAKTFKLYTSGANQRVFVNGITFVL